MSVFAKALTSSHTFTHTYERVRQGECGEIERGCRDKELRHWGGGAGAGVGAGGRVLGLEVTAGCSTARYTASPRAKSHHCQTLEHHSCPNGSHTQQQRACSRGRVTALQHSFTLVIKFQSF